MKIKNFLSNLEFVLELESLREMGLTEEEICGYFEFYADDWIKDSKEDSNKYVN